MNETWLVILILTALTLAGLGIYAWRQRTTPGAMAFGLLMCAIAGWSLAYALELLAPNLSAKMFWIKAEYLGIATTPVLWLAFALQYTGRGWLLSRRKVALVSLVPATTVVLVWTNELHRLFYSQYGLDGSGPGAMVHVEYGPWFWVHTAFSYCCLLIGTLLLGQAFFRSPPLYRRQAGILLIGALIPWLGNAFYLSGLSPWPDLDLTPLAFSLSGLVVAYGLFRCRLLQVVPVARRVVVDKMPTAMIVLDAEGRIADLNPAAQRLFGLTNREAIGQPARQALGPSELVERYADVAQADTEIERGEGDDRRVYRMTITPLGDEQARIPPRLVLISDVTEQVRTQETLTVANRRLVALQEGTMALTALLDPANLFDRVIDQLERLLPYRYAALGLYDEAAGALTYVASRGFSQAELAAAERSALQRHPGWVVRHRTPLLVDDAKADPRVQYIGGRHSRSVLIVPVVYQDRCLGILGLSSAEPAAYSPADRDLLLAFANQVAVALENARLYDESRRWADRSRVLYEVSIAAATAASLDETLQRTVQAVQQTMGPDNVALLLLEPETEELVIRAWIGFPDGPTLTRRQVGVGVPGWVVQTGQPALIPDVRQDPRYHACDQDARSELCVPLQVGPQVIGALNLESRRPAAFTESDLRLLAILAGNLATIIENSRLGEEAQAKADALARRNRHLSLLNEIAQVAASTLDLPTLYQTLADTLAQIIDGDGCYITRIDKATGQVLGSAASGPLRDSYGQMRPPPGEITLTESVLKAGRPLAVKDVFHSPYLSPRIAEMFPARSQLGLPLRVGERAFGAVLLAFNEPHTFTDEEITWATQAVDLTALALENARLYEEVKTWAAELEQRVEMRTRELQDTQAQLLHAEKLAALGQLSASIAHEIGNPLGLLQGYIEILAEELPTLPYLPPIQNAVEQLRRLLAQLRDFSRPAAEERALVAINEVVDRVLALAGRELSRSRVQVERRLAETLPLIEADARQLEQVFLNLILNTRDAMPQGGKLWVRTRLETTHIVVEFTDTGMGIPSENLERIFEPYFTTKEDKGTGLGLAICRRIVEAHGGRIEAVSQPDEGATFRVYLPPR